MARSLARSRHLVVCPDKFRGTATASEVTAAIAAAATAIADTAAGMVADATSPDTDSPGTDSPGTDSPGTNAAARDVFTTMQLPMADGGEGTLEALSGANQTSTVTGPLGQPVEAEWRLAPANGSTPTKDGAITAIIEMAKASGLQLAGGAEANDPLAATTRGTGELIAEAITRGATRIIVSLGGSATTDGGLGALQALEELQVLGALQALEAPQALDVPNASNAPNTQQLSGVKPQGGAQQLSGAQLPNGIQLIVACDVQTKFTDAAKVFGPQKGATPAQVKQLTKRLTELSATYQQQYGVDVSDLPMAGAAGGLAGGLAACGAQLVSGFELVAQEVGLAEAIADASLVITGEGLLDEGSFDGKVVGGVAELAAASQVPLLVLAGRCDSAGLAMVQERPQLEVISLTQVFGEAKSLTDTLGCIRQAVSDYLAQLSQSN